MNYKQLIKEINTAVAGLPKDDAEEINMIDWINDNLVEKDLFNKTEKERKQRELIDGISYLFKKIDWGRSNLDAKAVTIMNNLSANIKAL